MQSCKELCPYAKEKSRVTRCPNRSGLDLQAALQECAIRIAQQMEGKSPYRTRRVISTIHRSPYTKNNPPNPLS